MGLYSHLDRLAVTASKINNFELDDPPQPITRALLDGSVTSLFRHADADECNLFTKNTHSSAAHATNVAATSAVPPTAIAGAAVARHAIPMATPLRKTNAPLYMQQPREPPGPEVYYRAALKYVDKYAAFRDLAATRAKIESALSKVEELRDEIEEVESAPGGVPPTPKATVKDDERQHRQLQARIARVQRQRDALKSQLARVNRSAIAHAPLPAEDEDEDGDEEGDTQTSFWAPKSALSADTDEDSSNIFDQELDDADDMTYNGSPLAKRTPRAKSAATRDRSLSPTPASSSAAEKATTPPAPRPLFNFARRPRIVPGPRTPPRTAPDPDYEPPSPPSPPAAEPEAAPDADLSVDSEVTDDSTVVLAAPPATPPRDPNAPPRPPPSTAKRKRAEILGLPDVPRITKRIWDTMGEVLSEGTGTPADAHLSPEATMMLLERLANPSLMPSSTDTTGEIPTLHRLIARMLLALIRSEGPPRHTVPQAMLRAEIAAAAVAISAATGGEEEDYGVQWLYGCVAKKCVRIDRATREQRVGFDFGA